MQTRRSLIGSTMAVLAAPFIKIASAVAGTPPVAATDAPGPWAGQDPEEIIRSLIAELGGPYQAIDYLSSDVVCHLEFVYDDRAEGKADDQIDAVYAEFYRRQEELDDLRVWAQQERDRAEAN